ncbi:hypothetical protein Tco_0682956 [Tanacetum coccineum]|uniref:Retrotransposon gag domain-containing protein n=1 Tax=Tanacetum coccineum TaxID=301880 RepID=A0ABQ4XTK3_9ASTR
MRELREDTFFGNKNGLLRTIDRVFSIVGLFNIPGVSKDAIMLRVFPSTLTGSAKRWVDRLALGTINTWDLLKKSFIQRYCPPSMTAKQLEDIHNFKQEGDGSLYQAWEWYNDLLYKCPTHDINNHQKGPIPRMTPAQALTAIQNHGCHSHKCMTKYKQEYWESKRLDAKFAKDLTSTRIVPSTRKLNKLKRSDIENLDEQRLLIGTMEERRPFLATIHAEIDVFTGKISLGINEDRISFDTTRKDHNYTNLSEKHFMVRPQSPGQSNNQIDYEESGKWDNSVGSSVSHMILSDNETVILAVPAIVPRDDSETEPSEALLSPDYVPALPNYVLASPDYFPGFKPGYDLEESPSWDPSEDD